MKKYVFYTALFWVSFAGCSSPRQTMHRELGAASPEIVRLADSIMQVGLDHEALYTLFGSIKPISSVVSFGYPLANTDTAIKRLADAIDPSVAKPYLDSLQRIQHVVNLVNAKGYPDIRLVMSPFKLAREDIRIMQVYAIRTTLLDSVLRAEERFFGQFGLVPGADPAVVVNTMEYEDKYERLRGYGYLFGYPPYAVDFFVKAFHQSDTSGQHVERDFFQIPVHAREDGHFVYAIPKGHQPTADMDSTRYHQAVGVLESYRAIRNEYLNPDSTLRAIQLLDEWYGVK